MELEILAIVSLVSASVGGLIVAAWHYLMPKVVDPVADVIIEASQRQLASTNGSPTSCAVCSKPPRPLRTHDGRWLCEECKAIKE
jgi:hypothetical protein